jgi:radical SAM superfamily enzyme YgiQ (UPF0313 family)|tara:strand:- start:209 stop:2326 length:2118 start_codon:yes stop_codon:yes gene_type:complete
MKKKLKVFLCDLTYDTIILVSDTIPINIGFIGSYSKKMFGEDISIELFKYPKEVIEQIKKDPPDVIGFSNYSWNSNLSEYVASIAKDINPNIITIQGGTNFPHQTNLQEIFLRERPYTDFHTLLEGEIACSNIIERIFNSNFDKEKIFNDPIDGVVFIHPNTKKFIKGNYIDRIKDLDEIPSPYLNGMLDKFFDGYLTPFIETNRGCPFTCSFCHTGSNYYHKLNKFSKQRVEDEINYIGEKAGKLKISNLHLADVNFGMYPQDRLTCEFLKKSKETHGWPKQIMATTGKNSKDRVMEITNILGDMFSINMSMQSMDEQVLKNIKRANIKLDHMIDVNNHLIEQGRSTKAELIVGLPGESKKTFLNGLDNVLNSNSTAVTIYTLMMLHGTEFKNPEYREQFGYLGKFRIVPLNFGNYENKKIFDYEEVGVQTKDLSYDDYLYLRVIALLVESLHNGRPFNEFFLYAKNYNIQPASLLKILYDNIPSASKGIQELIKDFIDETKGELWDSEEKLLEFYRKEENYLKLKNGELGGNLIYKYKSKNIVENSNDWIELFERQLHKEIIKKNLNIKNKELIKSELSEISKFCKLKTNGLLNPLINTNPISYNFNYNILDWIDNYEMDSNLNKYLLKKKEKYIFSYTKEQIEVRDDVFKRYGTSINALSKIVTRISNLESQFRKVRHENDNYLRDVYKKVGENFTRYALSN